MTMHQEMDRDHLYQELQKTRARLALTLDCLRRLCDRPGKKGKRTLLQKLRQAGDAGLDHEDYFLALDIEKVLK